MQRLILLLSIGLLVAQTPGTGLAQDAKQDRDPTRSSVDLEAQMATHREVEPLAVAFKRLTALRLDSAGNLLACDADAHLIKVISPAGKEVGTLKLEFGPEAIDVSPDGTIYTGGEGRLAKLDRTGKVLKEAKMPENAQVPQSAQRRASTRPQQISGIANSGKSLFVAFGTGWSLSSKSKLFRFDLDLENPKLLDEGLRGCCQRCDIAAHDGVVYVAENSAHRVVLYDVEGKVQDKWGERSRTELAGFGSCCNPMNLAFDARGALYTAESGLGRVKCYTTAGKLLGLVGYVGVERFSAAGGLAASCSNIAIAVSPGGDRVYVVDSKSNLVRVLEKKT